MALIVDFIGREDCPPTAQSAVANVIEEGAVMACFVVFWNVPSRNCIERLKTN